MVKKGVVYVEYISNGVDQNVPVVALYYMLGQDTHVQKKSITKKQASNGCKRLALCHRIYSVFKTCCLEFYLVFWVSFA